VQALYSHHRPDVVLPIKVEGAPVSMELLPPRAVATYGAQPLPPYKPEFIPSLYAVAGQDQRAHETVLFLVNPFAESRAATIELRGIGAVAPQAQVFVLTSGNPDDANSFESPTHVAPREEKLALSGSTFKRTLAPQSFTVIRVRSQPHQ
jgi:alpha-L-arabinofuranosidase